MYICMAYELLYATAFFHVRGIKFQGVVYLKQ